LPFDRFGALALGVRVSDNEAQIQPTMSKTDINRRIRELQQELIRLSMITDATRGDRSQIVIRELSINRQRLRTLS